MKLKSMSMWVKLTAVFCVVFSAVLGNAAEITAAQAKRAVGNWRLKDTAPLGTRLGVAPREAIAHQGSDGAPLFYEVPLEGGGFVVTSADNGIQPVIAFSQGSNLVADARNPLWSLLHADLAGRKQATFRQKSRGADSPEAQWEELLSGFGRAKRLEAVSDVRRAPLVQSKWGQGGNIYNYHYITKSSGLSSKGYPAGCVATCGAQIMRYFEWPVTRLPSKTYECTIDGVPISTTFKGGFYEWSRMPMVPGDNPTVAVRDAIGALILDVGIASKMNWLPDESLAFMSDLAIAFTNRFRYKDVQWRLGPSEHEFQQAILSNLDFGNPCAMSIVSSAGGHAVITDGYGYHDSVLYCHLNMGWEGVDDAWYSLTTVETTSVTFNALESIIYNIATEYTKGVYCSGRILDRNGNPAVGAACQAYDEKGKLFDAWTVTDSKGIFAFRTTVSGDAATWQINASVAGWRGGTCVELRKNTANVIGNVWGADVYLDVQSPYTVTLHPSGGSGGTTQVTVYQGAAMPLARAPSRTGYTFTGYFSASGTQYYSTAMSPVGTWNDTSATTLYARWQANVYTVTFDMGGGSGGASSVDATFNGVMPSAGAPSRAGYTFAGYFDAGNVQYYSAGMAGLRAWDKSADSTLYARWSPNRYSVVFDAQGGTVAPESKTVAFSATLGALPVPALDGWYFAGWWTEAGGGGVRVTRSTVLAAEGLTLYAHWVDDPALAQAPFLCSLVGGEALTTAGQYECFLYDADNAVRGTLSLKVSKLSGTLTAKAVLQNAKVNFSMKAWGGETGVVDVVSRTGERLALRLTQGRCQGEISGGRVGGTLAVDGARNRFADVKDAVARTRLNAVRGVYTVALPDADGGDALLADEAVAGGSGYLSVTVGVRGSVKVAGALADGTSVSLATKLLAFDDCGGRLAIPLFKPLYAKKGSFGGVLWLDEDGIIRTDWVYGWDLIWQRKDGTSRALEAAGGIYRIEDALTGLGALRSAVLLDGVPVTVSGKRLKVSKNMYSATLALTARTGVFKGRFKLDKKSVSYAGVLIPSRDMDFASLPAGMGYGLALQPDRTKLSVAVWLE